MPALPVLDSAERAYQFWSGDYRILPILDSIFRNTLYPFFGLLGVGNDLSESLLGGFASSLALQACVYGYVGWNYQEFNQELKSSNIDPPYVGILPSGKDAIRFVRSGQNWNTNWRDAVEPVLMRIPIYSIGGLLLDNDPLAVVVSSALGSIFMEWAVVDHTREKLKTQ